MTSFGEKSHTTTAAAWHEWKKRCAAGLCGGDTQRMLCRFGEARFNAYIRRFAAAAGRFESNPLVKETADAWHLLETHAHTGNHRSGKRYKDWMFDRANEQGGDFVSAMEAGASLLMRDVVRLHLRREHAPAFMTSMNKPVGTSTDEESAMTLEDLLPGGVRIVDEIADREWNSLAQHHAGEFFARLDKLQAMTIWARSKGISFSDRRLLQWAKSNDTRLHKIYQRAMYDLGKTIKAMYPDEEPAALVHMAVLINTHIADAFFQKYFVQTPPPRSFNAL